MAKECRVPRDSSASGGGRARPAAGGRDSGGVGPAATVPTPSGSLRTAGTTLPLPPPGPPPPGAIRVARTWSQVAQGSDSSVASVEGPGFSVPFVGPVAMPVPAGPAAPDMEVECCFLEDSDDPRRMEQDLARAVVVTVTGARPPVDLADAAPALHA